MLVAVGLMMPRLRQAEFGLFDDANSISVAKQTWAGEWDWTKDLGQYGRFRPVYWLGFSVPYRWAELQPAWYFFGNLLLLSLTSLLLGGSLLRLTQSPTAAGVAGMAFVLGGPVIEAAYTLSKPELLQCFLMVAAAATIILVARPGGRWPRIGRLASASFLILLAAMTKETTGVLLIASLAWLGMAWLWNHLHRGHPLDLERLRDFTAASAVGIVTYAVLALAATPTIISAAGPRANFGLTWATIVAHAMIWIDLLVRDWLYLVPLFAAAAVGFVAKRRWVYVPLMVGALTWIALWFALYLPYRFTPEYYLLPLSLGASVLAGLLALQALQPADTPAWKGPAFRWAALAVAVGLFLLTIPSNLSNASIQLTIDKANADMLRFVAERAPSGARVFVNIRTDSEYLWNVGPLLDTVYGRQDLEVLPYPVGGDDLGKEGRPTFIVSPFTENIPSHSVRLGIPEAESRRWETALQEELGGRLELQRESRSQVWLAIVDAPRLICLAARDLGYCQRRNVPFDTRRFAAGWRTYLLVES